MSNIQKPEATENQDPNVILNENPITEHEERQYWKERAAVFGLDYAKNITTDKLIELVKNHQLALEEKAKQNLAPSKRSKMSQLDEETKSAREDALALVRFKINVLDPNMQSATGIYVVAGNENIAPVKRTIPFNAPVWHTERIIIEHLKAMRYTQYKSEFNSKLRDTFNIHDKPQSLPKFLITELPLLTEEELENLRDLQAKQNTGRSEEN